MGNNLAPAAVNVIIVGNFFFVMREPIMIANGNKTIRGHDLNITLIPDKPP